MLIAHITIKTKNEPDRRRTMKNFAPVLLYVLIALAPALASASEVTGTFTGASGHATTGSVEVVKTDDGWEVRLKDDFTFDGAPDPRVGFGIAGKFVALTDFEPLRSNSGAQIYKVPTGIDPAAFDEVYIWCRQYSVPLGVAKLTE
jgi:electron transfer DM13